MKVSGGVMVASGDICFVKHLERYFKCDVTLTPSHNLATNLASELLAV